MKKKIILINIVIFTFLLLLVNISIINKSENRKNIDLSLKDVAAIAQTGSEVECIGDRYPGKTPNVKGLCTCDGQVVYSQTCHGSGIGCSEINCNDN